jgi:hypothetical protein
VQVTRNSLDTQARPSDTVAAPSRSSRLRASSAMLEVDDEGHAASSGDHVSDDEYAAAPAIDRVTDELRRTRRSEPSGQRVGEPPLA